MYLAPGIGLAAPQVGVGLRLVVRLQLDGFGPLANQRGPCVKAGPVSHLLALHDGLRLMAKQRLAVSRRLVEQPLHLGHGLIKPPGLLQVLGQLQVIPAKAQKGLALPQRGSGGLIELIGTVFRVMSDRQMVVPR